MSYGIQQWGLGSWGGSDFVVLNHVPVDNSTGISRRPTISFALVSQSGNVTINTINLTINSTQLIVNGVFTSSASGTINASNPANVIVTALVLHALAPFTAVTVVVDAQNTSLQHPASSGTSWQFVVNNAQGQFSNYIIRKFERVFRVGSNTLDAPRNPHAIVELNPPPNLAGTVI